MWYKSIDRYFNNLNNKYFNIFVIFYLVLFIFNSSILILMDVEWVVKWVNGIVNVNILCF